MLVVVGLERFGLVVVLAATVLVGIDVIDPSLTLYVYVYVSAVVVVVVKGIHYRVDQP